MVDVGGLLVQVFDKSAQTPKRHEGEVHLNDSVNVLMIHRARATAHSHLHDQLPFLFSPSALSSRSSCASPTEVRTSGDLSHESHR